jgi:hypothetical protein
MTASPACSVARRVRCATASCLSIDYGLPAERASRVRPDVTVAGGFAAGSGVVPSKDGDAATASRKEPPR